MQTGIRIALNNSKPIYIYSIYHNVSKYISFYCPEEIRFLCVRKMFIDRSVSCTISAYLGHTCSIYYTYRDNTVSGGPLQMIAVQSGQTALYPCIYEAAISAFTFYINIILISMMVELFLMMMQWSRKISLFKQEKVRVYNIISSDHNIDLPNKFYSEE